MFLVSGGSFVIFAGFWGAFAFTDATPRAVQDVVGPAGWTAAFVGLLGLYPRLVERTRWLSRAGATFAVLGVLGAVVSTLGNLFTLLGMAEPPAWVATLQLPLLVGIVLGFLSFAFAALRTGAVSRRVGVLLAAPAAIFVVNVVRVSLLGSTNPSWAPFVLGSAQALALLSIGYSLRSAIPTSYRPEPERDPTAR